MPDGKPSFKKFSAIKREAYLNLLREGNHKTTSARAVGVSPSLVCLYRQAHPEFAGDEEAAQMEAHGTVENALFKTAIDGNVTAQQVWLYNRVPDRWQDKRNIEHKIDLNAQVNVTQRVVHATERYASIFGLAIEGAGEAGPAQGNGAGEPLHSPGSNGQAS